MSTASTDLTPILRGGRRHSGMSTPTSRPHTPRNAPAGPAAVASPPNTIASPSPILLLRWPSAYYYVYGHYRMRIQSHGAEETPPPRPPPSPRHRAQSPPHHQSSPCNGRRPSTMPTPSTQCKTNPPSTSASVVDIPACLRPVQTAHPFCGAAAGIPACLRPDLTLTPQATRQPRPPPSHLATDNCLAITNPLSAMAVGISVCLRPVQNANPISRGRRNTPQSASSPIRKTRGGQGLPPP